jgi:hypothetical protein
MPEYCSFIYFIVCHKHTKRTDGNALFLEKPAWRAFNDGYEFIRGLGLVHEAEENNILALHPLREYIP